MEHNKTELVILGTRCLVTEPWFLPFTVCLFTWLALFCFWYFLVKVFFRASLAILRLSELRLLELDLESIMLYLSRFPDEGVLEKSHLVPAALATKV